MRARSWQRYVVIAVMAVAVAGVAARAQEEAKTKEGESKVILSWETFRELTATERTPVEEPKLILPWEEVVDLLGVEVEDEALKDVKLPLDWRQFRALLEWSIEQREPEEEKVTLPADFIVSSADLSGALQEEGASFELRMSIDILKEKDWKRIPLLPATVALKEAKLPPDCFLNVAKGHYELLTTEKGKKDVVLSFAAAVSEQAGAYRVNFGMVPAGTSTVKLTVPSKDVTIEVAGAQAVLPLEGEQDETVVGASLPSGAPVSVTWQRALKVVEKVSAKLYAETRTLVLVGDGILTCRERVDLSVLHSGIRAVALGVPEGVSVLDVTGAAVHDWNVADGKLEARFAHEVLGPTSLELTYELARGETQATVQAPVLSVEGAVREKGHVGVVALANVEIRPGEEHAATSIDVRALPVDILRMTTQPVLLAFRYIGGGLSIPLVVQKHEDVKVLLTILDTASLVVMQTIDGPRITKALYSVRNNRNQFLRVKMPDGADVWSVSVAGKSVRPGRDEEGRVLIPLVRSDGAQRGLSAFPVEIVYVEKPSGVLEAGTMEIALPATNEAITHMMVQLYLPAEGSYRKGLLGGSSFSSALHQVDKFTTLATVAVPDAIRISGAAQAEQLQQQFTQRVEQEARDAGVKPIRVRLPIRGKVFKFEKILVIDEELSIGFRYSGWERD